MRLASMRYKDYVWPHNPRVYTIEYKRTMGARKVPFGATTSRIWGPAQRVMRGEGEFVGEGAYGEFKKLATVFYAGGPGLLVHPVCRPPTPTLWSSHSGRSPGRTMWGIPLLSGRDTTDTAPAYR